MIMQEMGKNWYASDDGHEMRREFGKTPNGNQLNGKWVLRDSNMTFIDFDQYRNDLAERNDINIAMKTNEDKDNA